MTYKGFTARIEFDDADSIFHGRLLGIRDVVGFHADSVDALRHAFHEAVDDYLETCAKLGKTPEKPVSGRMMLRVPTDVHRAALTAAESAGLSLNQWAADALDKATREPAHR